MKKFSQLVSTFPWIESKHIDAICAHLELVESGKIKRLKINIPPGYAKSYFCSRMFPAWYLMRHPTSEFLLVSYGDDLAKEHSGVARQIYTYWVPQITGKSVNSRSDAIDRWLIDMGSDVIGGGMRAVGINSAVTGKRADCVVIDDPYKNWQEASSESQRLSVVNNYISAVRNRLKPGGAIVLIHNRWHKEDLSGWLDEEYESGTGEEWVTLSLPARAVENDPLGREVGEVLWPGYYDDGEVSAIEKASGVFWYSQHQQDPQNIKGKVFQRD